MSHILQSQLDSEKSCYEKLLEEERKGHISSLALSRMQREIYILERLINGKKNGHKSVKHRYTRGFIRYVFQIMHRFRDHQERGNYPVSSIPAKAILQTQTGIA